MITAVFGDALLNPATGETARDAVVLIEDGHVTKAGARDGTQVARDAQRIDAMKMIWQIVPRSLWFM